MYYGHFGLHKPPFKITPDTSFFYSGGERGSVLDALSYVVLSGEGITKVIGEVGSGKTMLCRMLEERLPEHVETVYIANPSISPENILNVIAFEAGLVDQPKSKLEVMQQLQSWLLQKYTQNRRVVVLIEEAQGMPLETLEEIRLLSNLETAQDKLLQIVLFGQPELDENLAQASIRQLRERITHSFYLSPFARKQAQDYLNFRIRNAGYHGPDLFDAGVSRLIGFYSRGLVRRLNILADKVLLAAYADNTTRLRETHVHKAVVDSHFADTLKPHWKMWSMAAAGLVAGLCLASALWWWQRQNTAFEAMSSQVSPSVTTTVSQNDR
ncbi:MAG TPA: AAA family ATPase [Gammaproteobacteria bacterium]